MTQAVRISEWALPPEAGPAGLRRRVQSRPVWRGNGDLSVRSVAGRPPVRSRKPRSTPRIPRGVRLARESAEGHSRAGLVCYAPLHSTTRRRSQRVRSERRGILYPDRDGGSRELRKQSSSRRWTRAVATQASPRPTRISSVGVSVRVSESRMTVPAGCFPAIDLDRRWSSGKQRTLFRERLVHSAGPVQFSQSPG